MGRLLSLGIKPPSINEGATIPKQAPLTPTLSPCLPAGRHRGKEGERERRISQ